MFRSSVLLFALTAACGDKDTGFGVPVDTDTVDTSDTQDTNETGEDTSVSRETDCANGEDDDGDGLVDCLDEDCDGEVSVDFDGKTGFCEFGQ